jgi:hypothetical protein
LILNRRRGGWKVFEGEVGEDAVGADFRRSGDEADVEDEREDGNLIEGEGIFLGKQGTVVEFAGDVDFGRTRIWKLSYNSGGSRFRI